MRLQLQEARAALHNINISEEKYKQLKKVGQCLASALT